MKLKELCKIKHGFAFKGKDIIKNYSTKYVLVTPGNFNIGGGFKKDKCKYFSENGNIPKDYILRENDLIVTMTDLSVKSDTLGYSALIPKDNNIYLHNQRIGLVHDIDESKVLKDYLYWFMRTKKYQQEVVASQSGTAIHHTSPDRILNIEINLPSIDNQRKIVKILSDVEHKIKNNNDTNNNLEEQLRLFFEEDILKKLNNENTYECSLYDQFDVIDNRGKTPPLVEYSKYPIIDVKVLSGTERVINYNNCLKYVSKETYDTFFRSGHPKLYDALLSTVGSLAELKIYLENIGTIAQNVVALRPKNDYPLFMYQYILSLKQRLTSYDIGSVQPSIKVTQFMKEIIKIPKDKDLIYKFENLANANTFKMKNLMMENRYLEQLRDTLLPKLMNGEIDLDNIEI